MTSHVAVPLIEEIAMELAIGLDAGHSALKAQASLLSSPTERLVATFPTCVEEAIPISDEGTKLQAEKETITIAGRSYFFGTTALKQGTSRSFVGLNRDWVLTHEHDALLLGGIKTIVDQVPAPPSSLYVVLGLPAGNYNAQKTALAQRATALISSYMGSATTDVTVRVKPQPYGALQNIIILPSGQINQESNLDEQSWGVIDIGHGSTDFLLFEDGEMIQRAFGSSEGVSAVYSRVEQILADKSLNTDLKTVHKAVATGKVTHYGKDVDISAEVTDILESFARKIIDEAKRRFGDRISAINGIFVAGGGAEIKIVFERLLKEFPHTIKTSRPQFSVSEGFTRFALFLAANRHQ